MDLLTLKLDRRSTAGKTLHDIIDIFLKQPGVELVDQKSPYNLDFVNKIEKARKEKGGKTVTSKNLWQSIK